MIKYSIVIPTYNHLDDCLKPCLESIIKYTNLIDVEIIVVANGCIDDTKNYVESLGWPFKLLWFDEGIGFTKSTNEGIKIASGEFILLLNNDTQILPSEKHVWIETLSKPFLDSNVAMTGIHEIYSDEIKHNFLVGYCLMVRRSIFDEIGLLDECFSPGFGEDIDFCARILKKGYSYVNIDNVIGQQGHYVVGDFPFYHAGSTTFHDEEHSEEYEKIVQRNIEILKKRYKEIKYSIIIPTYNRCEDLLKPCLESIKLNTDLSNVEVIIIANGCTDNTKEYIESLGSSFKLLFYEEKIGYTKAANVGLKYSRGKFAILLGNDTVILSPNWISILKAPFEKHDNVGMTGPLIHKFENKLDYVVAYCAMISKNAIEKVGYYDEIFSPGGAEDVDYGVRLTQNGFKILKATTNEKDIFRYTQFSEFPVLHKGFQTFRNEKDWLEVVLPKNDNIIKIRYQELLLNFPIISEELLEEDFINGFKSKDFPIPKVYDCFTFFNEYDLLELRLNELNDVVDYFVLVEGNLTFTGKPKPLYFDENKNRFQKFLHKIIHVKVDDWEAANKEKDDNWTREIHQRNAIIKGLTNCKNQDIIIVSDVDEIPSTDAILNYDPLKGICSLKQKLYQYYINYYDNFWISAKIATYEMLKSVQDVTRFRWYGWNDGMMPFIIENGGWHFSYLGGAERIIEKLEAFSHQEFNTEENKNKNRIEDVVTKGEHLFNKDVKLEIVNVDETFPKYILNNIEYYKKIDFIGDPKGLNKIKFLIVMSNFGTHQLHYLNRVINTFKRFDQSKYEIDIVVHSNVSLDIEGVQIIVHTQEPEKLIEYSAEPGWYYLPWECRKTIFENKDNYDLFLYNENDVLYTQNNVDSFLEVTEVLAEDEIAGFIIYEEYPEYESGRFYPAFYYDADNSEWDYNSVFNKGKYTFAQFSNLHQASFLVTKEQLNRAINFASTNSYGDAFLKADKRAKDTKYFIRERCNTDLYDTGFKKVIPISHFKDFLIYHLPNKYFRESINDKMMMNEMLNKLLNPVKYSIIIPTFNRCNELLVPCLESVKTTTNLSNVEVIIIANGCTDNTKEYVESLGSPFKLLFYEEKLGFPKAINEGIKQSNGEYIVFLNNDTILNNHPIGWLNLLREPFDNQEKVGMTGPLVCKSNEQGLNDFLMFFCAMTTKGIINEIGLLDEIFSPGGVEDADFCLRLSLAGYKLVEVPSQNINRDSVLSLGHFPIFHKGHTTFAHESDWGVNMAKNIGKLKNKFPDFFKEIELKLRNELPDGWFPDENIDRLRKLVESVPDNGTIAQIGVFLGRSVCCLSDIILKKNLKVICIDTFEGSGTEVINQEEIFPGAIGYVDVKQEFIKYVNKFNIINNVEVMHTTSDEASEKTSDLSLDLVFIDGNHTYSYVKSDIKNWMPKLKSSGIICGHDYGTGVGVIQAVNEFFGAENINNDGGIWTVKDPTIDLHKIMHEVDRFTYDEMFVLNVNRVNPSEIKDKIIIDIGANIGCFALQCLELGAKQIYCFEPVKEMFSNLIKFMKNSHNVQCYNLAILDGSVSEVKIRNVGPGSNIWDTDESLESTKCISFADAMQFVKEKDEEMVLKLDCEGSEFEIVFNTPDEFFKNFSYMYIEIHDEMNPNYINKKEDLLKRINSLGFSLIETGPQPMISYPDGRYVAMPVLVYKFKRDNTLILKGENRFLYNEIFESNAYNWREEELKDRVVIDIGANVGFFSILAASKGAKTIYAYEPNKENYQRLVELTRSYKNIIPVNKAVAYPGVKYCHTVGEDVISQIIADTDGLNAVECISFGEILNEIEDNNIVLKIDCEGSEYDVILPTSAELLRKIKVIYGEFHENMHPNPECIPIMLKKFIEGCGFEYIKDDTTHVFGFWTYDGDFTPISSKMLNENVKYIRIDTEEKEFLASNSPKIYDCFPFFNELDLLEIRFNELYDVVDKFVITESKTTHSGQEKPLYLSENMHRFEKYKDKIVVIESDLINIDFSKSVFDFNWVREHKQRNDCLDYLKSVCDDNDYIIVSDIDEIPRESSIRQYISDSKDAIGVLQQDRFMYFLNYKNTETDEPQLNSKIVKYKLLKDYNIVDFNGVRYSDKENLIPTYIIENSGWHFTFMGGIDKVIEKVKAFAHQEYNTPEKIEYDRMLNIFENGDDVYAAKTSWEIVDIDDSFPKFIKENKEKYIENGWIKMKKNKELKNMTVTATISTRNRYYTTLPLCLTAIATQTRKPEKLIIFDDGDRVDLRDNPVYMNIFSLLTKAGIDWQVIFGDGVGQVKNHQTAINLVKTDFIWRLDDDNVPEANVLEVLLKHIEEDNSVGAVGGLVLDSKNDIKPDKSASNKIDNIFTRPNEQWFLSESDYNTKNVDHLYSSFLFRVSAAKHGYCPELSRVGHREETIFTYEMKLAGWKILITPQCKTWHFHNPDGGIRDNTKKEMWDHDEDIFKRKMNNWKLNIQEPKYIVLDSGLGDHYMFKSILPKIKERYENIVLAVCYPEVFEDENIPMISISEASSKFNDLSKWNIYKFMADQNWKSNVCEAYLKLYL